MIEREAIGEMRYEPQKIKQDKKSRVSAVIYLILLIITCVPAVAVRYFQLRDGTNLTTGFYSGPEQLNLILFGLLAALFLLVVISIFVDRNRYQITLSLKPTIAIQLMAFLAGVFSLISGAVTVYRNVSLPTGNAMMNLFTDIFLFLSAIGFFYMVWRMEKKNAGFSDALLCLPCLWSCLVLLSMFLQHMVVATVIENTINILRVTALAIFLLNVAKIVAGIAQSSTGRWLILSGSIAVFTGLCATIPPFLLKMITGQTYQSDHVLVATPLDFIILLFVIVFLIHYLFHREIENKQ